MTRTETELRRAVAVPDDEDALERLTAFATSLDAGTRRPRTPWALPLAAAVLVLTVVAGLGAYLGRRDGESPSAGGDGPLTAEQRRPTWAMRFDDVAGYTVRNTSAYSVGPARGTLATVQATDSARPERGFVTSTPCEGSEPCGKFPTATPIPVTIDGERGSFWPGSRIEPGQLVDSVYRKPWQAADESNEQQPQLVWQTEGTTVLVTGTFGFDPSSYDYDAAASRSIMLRLARAVTAGRHDEIRAPFALRNLPRNLAPESVQLRDGVACIGYGTGDDTAIAPVLTACRVTTGRDDGATLRAARIDEADTGGYSVGDLSDGTSVVVALDRAHAGLVSAKRLDRLATETAYAPDVADPGSWLVVR